MAISNKVLFAGGFLLVISLPLLLSGLMMINTMIPGTWPLIKWLLTSSIEQPPSITLKFDHLLQFPSSLSSNLFRADSEASLGAFSGSAEEDLRELTWFIHISDLHLSSFQKKREDDLVHWINQTVQRIIQPAFVVVTGDLTDAKDRSEKTGSQRKDEWQTYHTVLLQSNATLPPSLFDSREKTARKELYWVDLRGNHDCFDTFSRSSSPVASFSLSSGEPFVSVSFSPDGKDVVLLHRKHTDNPSTSEVNRTHLSHLQHQIILLDSCPKLGNRPPLNFFGSGEVMEEHLLSALRTRELLDSKNTKEGLIFATGHYPLASVADKGITSIVPLMKCKRITAYLSGHLHTMFNLTPLLLGRHSTIDPNLVFDRSSSEIQQQLVMDRKEKGKLRCDISGSDSSSQTLLELEVGDWKENRLFRLFVIDHNLFSIGSAKYNDFPIIVISNPKSATLLSPNEPLERIRLSSHIRFLVFSEFATTSFRILIDGRNITTFETDQPHPSIGVLHLFPNQYPGCHSQAFSVPWNPRQLSPGLHEMVIRLTDSTGKEKTIRQFFSVDGSVAPFEPLPQLILTTRVDLVFSVVCFLLWFLGTIIVFTGFLVPAHSPFIKKMISYRSQKKDFKANIVAECCVQYSLCRIVLPPLLQCLEFQHSHRRSMVFLRVLWVLSLIGPWYIGCLISPHSNSDQTIFSSQLEVERDLQGGIYGAFFLWGILYLNTSPSLLWVESFDCRLIGGKMMFSLLLPSLLGLFLIPSASSEYLSRSPARFSAQIILRLFLIRNIVKWLLDIELQYGWIAAVGLSPLPGWICLFIMSFLIVDCARAAKLMLFHLV